MPIEAAQSLSPMTGWGDKTPDWMGMRGPDGDGTLDWLGMRDLDGDRTLDLGTRGSDWLAVMDGGLLGMPVQGLQQYGRLVGGLGKMRMDEEIIVAMM